jgi:hypothetical protein
MNCIEDFLALDLMSFFSTSSFDEMEGGIV